MRERTTWNRDLIKQAAMKRQADPYTMNQDHPQPAADAYIIGGPSEFAEDVNTDNRWEDEYAGGQVKRDEIGMPDMRTETFNHPEKTAAMDEATLLKKANICVKTAKLMLPKTAKEAAIEDQAVALMNLPDYDLFETFTRLASEDQDEDQGEDQDKQAAKTAEESEDQGEEQDKQAGQMPPQFKENAEKKKEEAEAKKDEDKKDEDKKDEDKDDEGQKQAAQQFSQQDVQAMVAQAIQQQQQAQAQEQVVVQDQVAQQQAPVAQQDIQALIAEQVQTQFAQMQQQSCGQQAQQEPEVQADEEIIFDDIPADEVGIQMDAPIMDTGDVVLGPEDDVLQSLFATDDSQAQQDIQDQDQGQKQANVRTASTRTVGTKPTAGVSRIGGTPAQPTSDVDRLSGLWQSAPDVRDAFGLPNK